MVRSGRQENLYRYFYMLIKQRNSEISIEFNDLFLTIMMIAVLFLIFISIIYHDYY